MRKAFLWLGWAILLMLPVVFAIEIWIAQDLPSIEVWKWAIPLLAVVDIFFARDRDDVLKHHVI